jgi:hypothetical protein
MGVGATLAAVVAAGTTGLGASVGGKVGGKATSVGLGAGAAGCGAQAAVSNKAAMLVLVKPRANIRLMN